MTRTSKAWNSVLPDIKGPMQEFIPLFPSSRPSPLRVFISYFPAAVTKYLTSNLRKIGVSSKSEDMGVHHIVGRQLAIFYPQSGSREINPGTQLISLTPSPSFFFPVQDLAHRTVLLTFRVGLPSSVKSIWNLPQRHRWLWVLSSPIKWDHDTQLSWALPLLILENLAPAQLPSCLALAFKTLLRYAVQLFQAVYQILSFKHT